MENKILDVHQENPTLHYHIYLVCCSCGSWKEAAHIGLQVVNTLEYKLWLLHITQTLHLEVAG